jgi:hypothetical protein
MTVRREIEMLTQDRLIKRGKPAGGLKPQGVEEFLFKESGEF